MHHIKSLGYILFSLQFKQTFLEHKHLGEWT